MLSPGQDPGTEPSFFVLPPRWSHDGEGLTSTRLPVCNASATHSDAFVSACRMVVIHVIRAQTSRHSLH